MPCIYLFIVIINREPEVEEDDDGPLMRSRAEIEKYKKEKKYKEFWEYHVYIFKILFLFRVRIEKLKKDY